MIVFKRQDDYPQIEREFVQLDKRLYPILWTMEAIAWHCWRDHLVVTRIKEHKNDQSTHFVQEKPYRHIDVAILESGIENTETLRGMINALFPYGTKGFSTIPPLEHGTAPHMHTQVKPV